MTTTEAQETPDPKVKIPRARWSDAQIVRLSSNKPEDSAALWLLNGLVACNIAHGTIDEVIGAPAGTVMQYLKTNAPAGYNLTDADGNVTPVLMDDERAERLIDKLLDLKLAGAFTPRGLDLAAVLKAMLG